MFLTFIKHLLSLSPSKEGRTTYDGKAFQARMASNQYEVIGGQKNFWLYSKDDGYDLTHPAKPDSSPIYPRLPLRTTTNTATIDPAKTALIVVDLQNYFLSPALGRPSKGVAMKAVDKLLKYAIPACRKAQIPIVWLGWGVTEQDIEEMPPTIIKGFQDDANFECLPHWPVGKLGADIGPVKLEDGSTIEGGKVLKPGAWNTKFTGH